MFRYKAEQSRRCPPLRIANRQKVAVPRNLVMSNFRILETTQEPLCCILVTTHVTGGAQRALSVNRLVTFALGMSRDAGIRHRPMRKKRRIDAAPHVTMISGTLWPWEGIRLRKPQIDGGVRASMTATGASAATLWLNRKFSGARQDVVVTRCEMRRLLMAH